MTAELVARYTGFSSLEEYLDGYSITGARLAGLAVPATIITAVDDPIVPVTDLRHVAASSHLRAVVTPFGGHCGFLTGLSGDTWAENAVIRHLTRE
jgi:predicted alpha/beta-fold hydrolase